MERKKWGIERGVTPRPLEVGREWGEGVVREVVGTGVSEEGDDPDSWVPPVGVRENKKGREGSVAGGLKACWAARSPEVGPVGLITLFLLNFFSVFNKAFLSNKQIWPK
jgi:hypothetical protein